VTASVTIIIPAYNGALTIRNTLNSILAQTERPLEVIVVDDASSDDTVGIVESVARTATVPVRLLRHDCNSGGPAAPINTGVAGANGEYVAICEQDDVMEPTKVERIGRFIALGVEFSAVISRYFVSVDEGRVGVALTSDAYSEFEGIARREVGKGMYLFERDAAYRAALQINFGASLSNMVIRHSELAGRLKLDETLYRAVDYDLMLRTVRLGNVGWIDERLWTFRRHLYSAAATTDWKVWLRDYLQILRREQRIVKHTPMEEPVRQRLRTRYLDAAWRFRSEKRYSGALMSYLSCLWHTGIHFESMAAITKLLPQYILRR
jgi:glycosyltransferase involved in cell wall biosynthesis